MTRRISAADIALIILTLLLLMVIAYRVSGNVTPLLVVKSGSMEKTLKVGDVIVIEPASPEDINVDDVIVFWNPWYGNLVVHRVVHKTEEGVYTKGDANAGIDPWSPVPYKNIVGKWTGLRIPYWTGIGYLSLFLSGEIYPPYGMILLVGLIAINLFFALRGFLRRGREPEREPESSSRRRDEDAPIGREIRKKGKREEF
jgi:signal peptidase